MRPREVIVLGDDEERVNRSIGLIIGKSGRDDDPGHVDFIGVSVYTVFFNRPLPI
jgi:hypothetical protein